jgi:N-terminal domain of anti-restriction factor ArdC
MTSNTEQTQELTDKINESITALCAETDAAKQDETYRAWLRTLSRFCSYSFNNWLLIYTQRPDATRVAGFQTWKSLGRSVKKGERGIRIFAPIIRKIEEKKNGATELVSRHVGFRSIAVFERLSRDLRTGFYAPMQRPIHLSTPGDSSYIIA